mgnify:CR=1 FL=1
MNLSLIRSMTRSAVFELENGKCFRPEHPFTVALNGKTIYESCNTNVFSLFSLTPSTSYTVEVDAEREHLKLDFTTEAESFFVDASRYGLVADGETDNTVRLQAALSTCPKGGTVYVPAGRYRTSSLFMKSCTTLYLEKGAVLLGDNDRTHYPILPGVLPSENEVDEYYLTGWEGNPLNSFAGLLNITQVHDVVVTGEGTLDCDAQNGDWWVNPKVKRIAWRPRAVAMVDSENVCLHGITVQNSYSWTIHPIFVKHLDLLNFNINNPYNAPNTDGIDPESCEYIRIIGVNIHVGDDCIAMKASKVFLGMKLKKSCEHTVIRNCLLDKGHGGIVIGSEMSGGIKNLFADNNTFDSPTLNYALRFKTNAERGGAVENIYLRNSKVKSVGNAVVHATMLYDVGRDGDYLPQFKNITIENLTSSGGEYGIFMEAFEEVPITGLVFRNVNISNVGTDIRALNWEDPVMENVTINGKTYPRPVETKILGVPVPGQRIEGSSTLLGGEDTDLSSKWLISDSADGDYHFFRIRRSYAVPSYLAGKYIKFVSTDRNGNQDASIPYKVLRSAEIAGTTNDAELLRAASKGYIDENDALDLNRPITKRECAKMLGKLWNLTAPSAPVTISDIPASDPDYGVIAAVVEAGMIELKDPTSAIAQGTLYNAGVTSSEGAKRTAFLPDATIDRDEMGHIALLSCGVPYNETLGTQPKFDDASQIESVYEDNVGASAYFGFVTAKTGNSYLPKEKTTLEDLIRIVERISDFNNK